MIYDSAPNQTQDKTRKFYSLCFYTINILEKGTPSSNRNKCYIDIVESNIEKDSKLKNSPLDL